MPQNGIMTTSKSRKVVTTMQLVVLMTTLCYKFIVSEIVILISV